jgi:hypothetical protein
MKKFVGSLNCEIFNGEEFDTIEEAVDYYNNDLSEGDTFYVGEKRELFVDDFINIDIFIEDMQERAGEEGGESAEDYLTDITYEQKESLAKYIVKWFVVNKFTPYFFSVGDIEEFKAVKTLKLFSKDCAIESA